MRRRVAESSPAAENGRAAQSEAESATRDKLGRRKRKFPYRKVEDLEAEIAELEEQKETLQADLASPEVYRDGGRVKAIMQAIEDASEQLQRLYEHWEEAVELN